MGFSPMYHALPCSSPPLGNQRNFFTQQSVCWQQLSKSKASCLTVKENSVLKQNEINMFITKGCIIQISLSATQPLRGQFREFPPSELVFPRYLLPTPPPINQRLPEHATHDYQGALESQPTPPQNLTNDSSFQPNTPPIRCQTKGFLVGKLTDARGLPRIPLAPHRQLTSSKVILFPGLLGKPTNHLDILEKCRQRASKSS